MGLKINSASTFLYSWAEWWRCSRHETLFLKAPVPSYSPWLSLSSEPIFNICRCCPLTQRHGSLKHTLHSSPGCCASDAEEVNCRGPHCLANSLGGERNKLFKTTDQGNLILYHHRSAERHFIKDFFFKSPLLEQKAVGSEGEELRSGYVWKVFVREFELVDVLRARVCPEQSCMYLLLCSGSW